MNLFAHKNSIQDSPRKIFSRKSNTQRYNTSPHIKKKTSWPGWQGKEQGRKFFLALNVSLYMKLFVDQRSGARSFSSSYYITSRGFLVCLYTPGSCRRQ